MWECLLQYNVDMEKSEEISQSPEETGRTTMMMWMMMMMMMMMMLLLIMIMIVMIRRFLLPIVGQAIEAHV